MNTTTWIVIGLIVLVLVAVAVVALMRTQRERKRVEAGDIRDKAAEKVAAVDQQEALAQESEAKARRAQAEADMKAAEAKKLAQQAQSHQGAAASSRDSVDAEFERADRIDPDVKGNGRGNDGTVADDQQGRHGTQDRDLEIGRAHV